MEERKKMLYHFSAQVCAVENYEENKSSKNYGYPRNRQSEKHWKRGITQSLEPLEMYYRALNRKHFGKEGYFFPPFLLREIALNITIGFFFLGARLYLFLEWLNVHKVTNYVLHCSSYTS